MDTGMWDRMPPHMRERFMHRMAMMGDMFREYGHELDHSADENHEDEGVEPPDVDVNEDDTRNEDNDEQQVEFNQEFDDQPSYHLEDNKDPADLGTDIDGECCDRLLCTA